MATANRKIVVHIVKGRLSGLRKIIGHLVVEESQILDFPLSVPDVDLGDHTGLVQHAGTYPRFILYREWAAPVTQTYGQQQRDAFDPRQA